MKSPPLQTSAIAYGMRRNRRTLREERKPTKPSVCEVIAFSALISRRRKLQRVYLPLFPCLARAFPHSL